MSAIPPPPSPPVPPSPAAPSPAPTPAPASGRWSTTHLAGAAVFALLIGIGVGLTFHRDDSGGTDIIERVEPDFEIGSDFEIDSDFDDGGFDDEADFDDDMETSTTRDPDSPGSQERPLALGERVELADGLVVTVDAVDFAATDAIVAGADFNDPPSAGHQYVLITVTVLNEGDTVIDPSFDVSLGLLGSAERLYDEFNATCMASYANPLIDSDELAQGESFQGNICLEIPDDEIADGSLLVSVSDFFGDDTQYVDPR